MICTRSVYVPGQTLTVSFGPDAVTAAWIDTNVACGQSPSSGVLSTQNVVPDDGGSIGNAVPSSAPTTTSPTPTTVVSKSPTVGSSACNSVDVTTFAGSTVASGSFCQACAFPLPRTSAAIADANSAKNSLFMSSPVGLGP